MSEVQWAVRRLEAQYFKFACTMLHIPHSYAHRKWWEPEKGSSKNAEYERVGKVILEHGEKGSWRGTERRYLHANGYKYWLMTTDVKKSLILNRANAYCHECGRACEPDRLILSLDDDDRDMAFCSEKCFTKTVERERMDQRGGPVPVGGRTFIPSMVRGGSWCGCDDICPDETPPAEYGNYSC